MTVLKTGPWPWLIVGVVLIVVGLLVSGTAGTIVLACGFLALLGAGIRLISRNDPPPPEGRVPAGHSGV
jgi:energy-converting hydrogenase Eha subunit G